MFKINNKKFQKLNKFIRNIQKIFSRSDFDLKESLKLRIDKIDKRVFLHSSRSRFQSTKELRLARFSHHHYHQKYPSRRICHLAVPLCRPAQS